MIDMDKWKVFAKVVLWIMVIAMAGTLIAHFVELAPLGEMHSEILEDIRNCDVCDDSWDTCSACENDNFEAKEVASQIAGVWKQTVINLFLIIAGSMLVFCAGEFSLIQEARNKEKTSLQTGNQETASKEQDDTTTASAYKMAPIKQDDPDENTCFCRKCGKRNVKNRNVCWSCGEPLVTADPKPQTWTCSCGRQNAAYVSTCTCGINKNDI